jgi:site-specific DNA recombinase
MGEANDLIIGFKATMNSEFLKELRYKVRRGLEGTVRRGKSAGGLSYGYDVVKHVDADREPIRGIGRSMLSRKKSSTAS